MKKRTNQTLNALDIALAELSRPNERVGPHETTAKLFSRATGITVTNAQIALDKLVDQGKLISRWALSNANRRCKAYGPPTKEQQ